MYQQEIVEWNLISKVCLWGKYTKCNEKGVYIVEVEMFYFKYILLFNEQIHAFWFLIQMDLIDSLYNQKLH